MALDEVVQFLSQDNRSDLKSAACRTISQLTGSREGLELVCEEKSLVKALIPLILDSDDNVTKDVLKALINISADERGSASLLSLQQCNIVDDLLKMIKNQDYAHADYVCGILANLSRFLSLCPHFLEKLQKSETNLDDILFILSQIDYNKKGASLDLLAAVIQNITQFSEGHRALLDHNKCIFERLLPFTTYSKSKERRKSIVAAIHNCCFEKEEHHWLLSEEIDLVPYLVLPLAGPDAFTEEENDSLPLDLQFLPEDKTREAESDIRALLLQSLMQLCATRACRKILRNMNIYLILREHHKWEMDVKCKALNEDLVNILIRTEDEIGHDDLTALKVPQEMANKFISFDKEYYKEDT